eukprot:gene7171-11036_t
MPKTTALFSALSGVSSEILIANKHKTVCSVGALLLELSDELTGQTAMRH